MRGMLDSIKTVIRTAALVAAVAAPAFGRGPRYDVDLAEDVQQTKAAVEAVRDVAGDCDVLLTKHYVVVYTGDLDAARARAEMLERGCNAFFTFTRQLRFNLAPPSKKLTVLVFNEQKQFNAYRAKEKEHGPAGPSVILQGYYDPETNWAAFFNQTHGNAYRVTREAYERLAADLVAIPGPPETEITVTTAAGKQVTTKGKAAADLKELADQLDAQFAAENQQVTLHEGAHQLAFNTGLQSRGSHYPFWVSEGLACVFETPSSNTTFGPFRVNLYRLKSYQTARDAGRLRGLRRLVGGSDLDSADVFDLYAESWSLFYFLLRRKPIQFREYLHELTERPPIPDGADRSAQELATFKRHFGDDLDAIEAEWSRYMNRLIEGNEDELRAR